MWTIAATLMLYSLGQAPDQQAIETRTRAMAPFMDSGVVAVLQLDLTQDILPALFGRLAAGQGPGPFEDASKVVLAWSNRLRGAGERAFHRHQPCRHARPSARRRAIEPGSGRGRDRPALLRRREREAADRVPDLCDPPQRRGGGDLDRSRSGPELAAVIAGRSGRGLRRGGRREDRPATAPDPLGGNAPDPGRDGPESSEGSRRGADHPVDAGRPLGRGRPGFRRQAQPESGRRFIGPRRRQVPPSTRGQPGRDGGKVGGFEGDHAGIPAACLSAQDRHGWRPNHPDRRCPGCRPAHRGRLTSRARGCESFHLRQ